MYKLQKSNPVNLVSTIAFCLMTGVPADKVLSTLHPTGPVSVETVEQSIKKEIHQEVESAATDTEEGQSPEKDLEEIKKVLEV